MSPDMLIGILVVLYLAGSVVAGIIRAASKRAGSPGGPFPKSPGRGEALPFPFPPQDKRQAQSRDLPEEAGRPAVPPPVARGVEVEGEGTGSPEEGVSSEDIQEEGPVVRAGVPSAGQGRALETDRHNGVPARHEGVAVFALKGLELADLARLGIVAQEILGPPRSLRPYRPFGWRRP